MLSDFDCVQDVWMSIGSPLPHRWQPVAEKIQENAKSRTPNCSSRLGNGTGHRTWYRVWDVFVHPLDLLTNGLLGASTKPRPRASALTVAHHTAAPRAPLQWTFWVFRVPVGALRKDPDPVGRNALRRYRLGRENSSRNMTRRTRKSCHSRWPPLLLLFFLAMYRTCKLSKIRQPIIEWRTPMRRNKP